eukprot:7388059-Pyramimonas_sp.AAC.2
MLKLGLVLIEVERPNPERGITSLKQVEAHGPRIGLKLSTIRDNARIARLDWRSTECPAPGLQTTSPWLFIDGTTNIRWWCLKTNEGRRQNCVD